MTVAFTGPAESEHYVEGAVALEDDQLIIEFEKERWFSKPKLERVAIPIDDIDSAQFKQGVFGSKVRIRMLHFENARLLPWRDGLTIDFVVSRSERDRASVLVDQIEAAIDLQEEQS